MSSIDPVERLNHILTETNFLETISAQIQTSEQLASAEILRRSAERSIEIMGEAVKDLPRSILQLSPNIKWTQIARMRDNLIHRYFAVDSKILYEVIKKDAPLLKQEVGKILERLNKEEYNKYRHQLKSNQADSSNFWTLINEQTKIDIAIAQLILAEYPEKFQEVAVAKVIRIIGAGERASELAINSEEITPAEYVREIITRSTQSNQLGE